MTVVTLVSAVRMYRSWSWFNATPLNKHFMHGSVSIQLNIYSFARQTTSVAVNISADTEDLCSVGSFFIDQFIVTFLTPSVGCVAKIEVEMILTASQKNTIL